MALNMWSSPFRAGWKYLDGSVCTKVCCYQKYSMAMNEMDVVQQFAPQRCRDVFFFPRALFRHTVSVLKSSVRHVSIFEKYNITPPNIHLNRSKHNFSLRTISASSQTGNARVKTHRIWFLIAFLHWDSREESLTLLMEELISICQGN